MKSKTIGIITAVVLVFAGAFIIAKQYSNNDVSPQTPASTTGTEANKQPTNASTNVKSLVSYVLPDGWKETSCPEAVGSVYVLPNGAGSVDCNANPSSPVKMSVDPGNNTDCNQLQNVQNVKKHTCISLYINGHKTLKSSTEYLASSTYKQDTTINDYYVDTGKGVVKLEYVFISNNQFQTGFDQLAKSVKSL